MQFTVTFPEEYLLVPIVEKICFPGAMLLHVFLTNFHPNKMLGSLSVATSHNIITWEKWGSSFLSCQECLPSVFLYKGLVGKEPLCFTTTSDAPPC